MDELIYKKDAINEISRFVGYIDEDMIIRIQTALSRIRPVHQTKKIATNSWIRINKSNVYDGKLPDMYDEVLVYISTYNDVFKAYRCGSGEYWYVQNFSKLRPLVDVDAWIPKKPIDI